MAAGRSTPLRRAGSFLALLVFEVGAVVLLGKLGRVPALRIPWHSLTPWLLNSPVEDVLAAILRMIALLIAWWLLGSNLLYLVASFTRVPGAIRAVRWCTLPVVRSVTDHAVALTLATSLVGGGTGATIAAATPAVAAAPHRSGQMTTGQGEPRADARAGVAGPGSGPVSYLPQPAGAPREADVNAAGAGDAGVPRAQQRQPEPGQSDYVPRPAGHPSAPQPRSTTSSTSTTSTPTSVPTTAPPPTNRGYEPHPAGPPSPTTAAPTTTTSHPTTTSRAPGSTRSSGGGPSTTTPNAVPTPVPPPPTTTPTPPTPPPERHGEAVHEVKQGDNLWTISRNRLAQVTERHASELSDHEIASYWLRVVAANRSSLRSGDPDLIFPGEKVQLPPVAGS